MHATSLVPSIEQRLSGWARIQQGLKVRAEPRHRPTVTLSREYGCEGYPVAQRLQALFEESTGEPWSLFDKALAERVAQEEGISPVVLEQLGHIPRAFDALGFKPLGSDLSQDALYEKVMRCIASVAAVGNAIVVGRGAAILCRKMTNCFHFRLIASLPWRVDAYARRAGVSRSEAEEAVKSLSDQRSRFVSRHLGADITDPRHFDAVFNNERHTPEEISRAVFAYVKSAWPERELFKR